MREEYITLSQLSEQLEFMKCLGLIEYEANINEEINLFIESCFIEQYESTEGDKVFKVTNKGHMTQPSPEVKKEFQQALSRFKARAN